MERISFDAGGALLAWVSGIGKEQIKQVWTYAKMAMLFGAVFLLSGLVLYLAEVQVNPRCRTYFDALWLTVVFFLSGFEDFGPVTTLGKAVSLLAFVLGAAFMVVVTGFIASIFVQRRLKEKEMPDHLEDHIAICHWNSGGDRIIRELHSKQAEPETDIVVITPKDPNEAELRKNPEYEKVFFVRNDPTLHEVLRRARVHRAKSVILLADHESSDPDATSVLIALAIQSLCVSQAKPHIVAEASDHRKTQHLRDAGVEEVVCAADYGLGILAQSALYQRLSEVYDHMLTYSGDTNEIYVVKSGNYPENLFLGKTFSEVAEMLNAHRDAENPVILVGLRRGRDGKLVLNPRQVKRGVKNDKFRRFEAGDDLILIAYDPPDLMSLQLE